ncbi:restriction endonuclease subunit S [Rubrivivax rivuli]|uniref:Restriction endonuclease subunit S n=1 Tax=Rubrivivax rivuli TaxID=1862385 RepID=A0A437R9B4_9BURK|nr:restriction endonuclease subunit S [Rubrivivax rivuli]RVU43370.1 restriction endonuclease subunit S [Rubrivivax rivuli]
MLPEGWRRSTLGEIARITSGGTPDRSEPSYWGGDVPWVTTGEIQFNTITETAEKITAAGLKNSSAKLFSPGTLLMAMYGQGKTRGQVAKLGIEAATNQACAAIHLHDGCSPDFYFHFLSSQYTTIRELGNAGTQQNLSGGILKAVTVPVPPLEEQRRIASILATWDDAIAVAGALWAKRMEQARLVREMLIGTALKHARFPLAEVADVRTGLAMGKTGQRDVIEVPYLRVANVQDGRLDLREVKLIEVAREHVSRYALQAGDVLMTEGGDFDKLGRGTVWSGEIDPCLHQNHVFAVRPKLGRVLPGFIAAIAASDHGRSYFLSCAKRSTNLASINSTQLKALPIPLVPMAEQERIVAIVDAAMQVAHGTKEMVDRLVQEKAALMADLLTGKRRVHLEREGVAA